MTGEPRINSEVLRPYLEAYARECGIESPTEIAATITWRREEVISDKVVTRILSGEGQILFSQADKLICAIASPLVWLTDLADLYSSLDLSWYKGAAERKKEYDRAYSRRRREKRLVAA